MSLTDCFHQALPRTNSHFRNRRKFGEKVFRNVIVLEEASYYTIAKIVIKTSAQLYEGFKKLVIQRFLALGSQTICIDFKFFTFLIVVILDNH